MTEQELAEIAARAERSIEQYARWVANLPENFCVWTDSFTEETLALVAALREANATIHAMRCGPNDTTENAAREDAVRSARVEHDHSGGLVIHDAGSRCDWCAEKTASEPVVRAAHRDQLHRT